MNISPSDLCDLYWDWDLSSIFHATEDLVIILFNGLDLDLPSNLSNDLDLDLDLPSILPNDLDLDLDLPSIFHATEDLDLDLPSRTCTHP